MSTTFRRSTRREAVTLIELLIVMGLLVVLASISLGAMKALLRGQKVSQASVTVRQYLQNAQTRAVASGRPVAVFLDRASLAGGSAGEPTPANFTVTRMQLGEVFPPYTGDFENAQGKLWDFLSTAPLIGGYANAIIFEPTPPPPPPPAPQPPVPVNAIESVASGFGSIGNSGYTPGFLSVGDIIEIDGCEARFAITSFRVLNVSPAFPYGALAVTFSNKALELMDNSLMPPASRNKQIPLSGSLSYRKFRVYRQPSKSLAGSIVLPRGTCIDLSLSGVGINDSAFEGGTFGIDRAPLFIGDTAPFNPNKPNNPGNFSRMAIVFNSDGRVGYLMREDSVNGLLNRIFLDGSSMIYLLVGRTDQVLPGFPANAGNLPQSARQAALQHPDFGANDLPKSNLVDPENVWITCNPNTGEVKTSPVVAIDDAVIVTRYGTPAVPITDLINQTRSLGAAGMSN